MVLDSQVQTPLDPQVQHALALRTVYRSILFSSRRPRHQPHPTWSSTEALVEAYSGGVGFRRRAGPAELERGRGLHDLPTLAYGVDQHCRTMVGCNLRQEQLQQGEHLKKRCKLWALTWHKKVGWAHRASPCQGS